MFLNNICITYVIIIPIVTTHGKNLVLLGTAFSISIANNLTVNEQDLLGNFLQVVAQNLLSMAAAVNDCNNICNPESNSSNDSNNSDISYF